MWLNLTLALLVLLPARASPRLEVRAREGKVTLKARAVPLWQVLDRLAGDAGMIVSYDGPRPAARVTATIEAPTAKELLVKVLRGQPVSYAFWPDPTGHAPERLLIGLPAPAVPAGASQPLPPGIAAPRPPLPASGPAPKFPAGASRPR